MHNLAGMYTGGRGVAKWEFTPTIVNGVAVPVITTVTNFTLQAR